MRKRLLVLFSLFLMFLSNLSHGEINVTVNKETVGMNESFQVIFVAKKSIRQQPDFSTLKHDFDIVSCVQSHNTTFINGVIDSQAQWDLTLMPKKEGKLVIPAITFDKESSEQKTILVTKGHVASKDDSIFIETELSPKTSVYQQSQLLCAVRLFRSVNLVQGALSDLKPSDQNAQVQRIGDDVEFDHVSANGTHYRVLERKYAIFPHQVGKLTFSPVLFEGNILVGKKAFFNVKSEYKRLQAEIPEIEVKPIPVPFTEHTWFPAYDVKLKEEWSSDPDKIAIGEPITWTLTVSTEGCLGNQIPDLAISVPNTMKQYVDKPEIVQEPTAAGFKSTKKIKIALIATKPGSITLPEITLNWWDLLTERQRTAQIPSRVIQIPAEQIALNEPVVEASHDVQEEIGKMQSIEESTTLPLWVVCLIGLNVIWISGLYNKLYKRIPFKFLLPKPNHLKILKASLKKACGKNNPKEAEKCFLDWAAFLFPDMKPLNLINLRSQFSEQMQEAISGLYKSLYGQEKNWDGAAFWKAFSKYKKQKPLKGFAKSREPKLRALYDE